MVSRKSIFSGVHYHLPTGVPNREHMQALTQLVEAGSVVPVIDTTYGAQRRVPIQPFAAPFSPFSH